MTEPTPPRTTDPSSPAPEPAAGIGRMGDVTIQVLVMCGLLALLVVVTGWYDPNFFSPFNLRTVLRDTAIWSLFALGQAVVIISGGIDLSVGSMICFLGVVTLVCLQGFEAPLVGGTVQLPLVLAIVLSLSLGVGVGVGHGVLVSKLDLQPFLVTLCSLLTFRGLSRVITNDKSVSYDFTLHPWLADLGSGSWLGIPAPVYILVAALIPLSVFMHWTVPGRYLYAIGYNAEAARYSGVAVDRLRILSYAICGLLTAIAAILEAGDVKSVPPSSAGLAYEMYGITGAVLGGCALRGGQGSLVGVVVGMAILRVIKSAVTFMNFNTYWTFAVTGIVLLAAVIIDRMVRRRAA